MGYSKKRSRLKQKIKETNESLSETFQEKMSIIHNSPHFFVEKDPKFIAVSEKEKMFHRKLRRYTKMLSDLEDEYKATHSYEPYVPTDLVDIEMTITIKGYINGHLIQ